RRGHPLHRALCLTVRLRVSPADEFAPALSLPRLVETAVDQDPVEPGRKLGLARERRGGLVEPDECLLGTVLGLFPIAYNRPRNAVGPLLIARDQQVEGRLITLRHSSAEVLVGRLDRVHHGRSSHTLTGAAKPATNRPSWRCVRCPVTSLSILASATQET